QSGSRLQPEAEVYPERLPWQAVEGLKPPRPVFHEWPAHFNGRTGDHPGARLVLAHLVHPAPAKLSASEAQFKAHRAADVVGPGCDIVRLLPPIKVDGQPAGPERSRIGQLHIL